MVPDFNVRIQKQTITQGKYGKKVLKTRADPFQKADLAHIPRLPSMSPSLGKIEAEIIFDISPTEFSRLATQVPLDDAARALNGMGVRVPSNVPLSDVSSVLRELQKLNQTQIDNFLRAVAQ